MGKEMLISNKHMIDHKINVLTLLMYILFAGCSRSGNNTESDKIDFGLKLSPGKSYVMQLIEEDKFSSGTQEKRADISHIKTTELGFDVKKVDDKGITFINVTLRAMKEKTVNPYGAFEYDYTDPAIIEKTPLTRVHYSMMGKSFIIKVASSGKLVGIDANDLFALTAEKIVEIESKKKRLTEQNAEQRATRLKQVIKGIKEYPHTSEEYLKDLAGNIIPFFPTRTAAAGYSWTEKVETSHWIPIPVDTEGTYTLRGNNKGTVVIEISAENKITDKLIPESGGQASYSGNVAVKGNLKINGVTGWLSNKDVKLLLEGEMKDHGRTRPISLESSITVESVE